MSNSQMDVLLKPDSLASAERQMRGPLPSGSCAKIKDLGFTVSKHIKMYGERFEIVSDPFREGDCVAVHAISGTNPEIRILCLPTTLLVGSEDRFLKRPRFTGLSTL